VTTESRVLKPDDHIFCGRLVQQGLERPVYVRGNSIPPLEKTVGIVGTRHASSYGLRVAYELGKYYASEGYVVVSGLAYGIDQKATKVLWKEEPQLVCWGMDLIFTIPNPRFC